MSFPFFSEHRAARIIGLTIGGITAVGAGLATAAALGAALPGPASRVAKVTGGDLSADAFAKLTASMDPSMLRRAGRMAPTADSPLLIKASLTGADVAVEPVVLTLQNMNPEQAAAWNAANPSFSGPNPAAKPFRLNADGVLDEARAVDCMTAAVYYEAAWETLDGQRAVAQVVLNRMRHPAYPKTVCGVVFQGSQRRTGCQFSFTCDGSMNRPPNPAAWSRSRQVAMAALDGYVMKKVGNATHYHANYVAPYWSPSLLKVGTIGAHIFYRWTGGAGMPGAFGGRYAGGEMDGLQIASLERLSTSTKLDVALKDQAGDEPAVELALPAPAQKTAALEAAEAPLLSVADAARDAAALVKADDLDWKGEPKQKGPPRLALPSSRL